MGTATQTLFTGIQESSLHHATHKCRLNSYLADIDEQATEMMFRLVEQMADKEGVTEQLKTERPMLWVGRINEIQARAREIVNAEIIYA